MASKRRATRPVETPSTKQSQPPAQASAARVITEAVLNVTLFAVHSALTQLLLSPVYGGHNAAGIHSNFLSAAGLLGSLIVFWTDGWVEHSLLLGKWIVPVYPCYFAALHAILASSSGKLGPERGPVTVELLTVVPLFLVLNLYTAARFSFISSASRRYKSLIVFAMIGMLFAVFQLDKLLITLLPQLALYSTYLTKVWLSVFASILGLTQSSPVVALAALPGIMYTLQRNPHLIWPGVRSPPDLFPVHYSLVDRRESVTGYISILENLELDFRVMRCDHSLLGGEWLVTDAARERGITGTEPVYAVFEMLEAVRLVQTTNRLLDASKSALVIGLGIGTAPKAMLAHGIATTIVELDPVVHEFATRYFDLPTNHTAVIEDAVSWTTRAVQRGDKYNYIIHDVFTGGAEPLALFTEGFVTRLRELLKPDAAIAINFAGSVKDSPGKQVLHTIERVFDGRCRIFRDLVPEEDNADADFSNMVIFCTGPGALKNQKPEFRNAVEADFLGSVSRRTQLVPRAELEIRFPSEEDMAVETINVLTEQNVDTFALQQQKSAEQHWKVMRQVVYPGVWEMW